MSTPDSELGHDAGRAAVAVGGAPGASVSRLDAHLHLWELAPGQYSWLKPAHGILFRSFTAEQAQEVLFAAGVDRAILVQADDTAADNEAMLLAAKKHDWIAGVVGWLPLEDPPATATFLQRWGAHSVYCGVRTLIHDDPRPDVLALKSVRESLAMVAEAGLPFDVPDAFPRYLNQVVELAQALPQLTVVIDHLGKPPRDGSTDEMARWKQQLQAVAALPNTAAKVSGLHAGGTDYSAQALEDVWNTALSAFGPDRLMFGGDWPVSLLGGKYRQTVGIAESLLSSLSPADRQAIWSGTAQRIYSR
ncbi:amidohydrolase family protein [Arthrobacter alpinus]|uniref:amidohydrolase family protein n=1 Tax=Arthrobacter alpinus TaxID=656366 RepID=UPI001B8B371A|nr:amidohydrolase family protein [Arthrobacter alpinus]